MPNEQPAPIQPSTPNLEVEIADAWIKAPAEKYLLLSQAAERLGKPLQALRHDELLNMVQQIEKETEDQ